MWSLPVYSTQLVSLAAVIVTACALLGTGTSILLDPLLNLAELPPPDADQLNPDPPAFSDPVWLLKNPVVQKMCHHPQDLQGLEESLLTSQRVGHCEGLGHRFDTPATEAGISFGQTAFVYSSDMMVNKINSVLTRIHSESSREV